MRPGAKIELLRKLARGLVEANDTEDAVDLVLRQFGFPVAFRSGKSLEAYALAQLEGGGSDEALVELDEYLFGGGSREELDASDLPWESGTFRLFISHTHEHRAVASGMRDLFAVWRIDAFVAHVDIEPTKRWEQVIEAALATCDAMTALITDDFITSRWCDQEVGYCLARTVPIVPVKLGADPHGFIAKFQAVTPKHPDRPAWIADEVFRVLARHAATANAMAAPAVYRYAASTNFNGARANFALLRQIPAEAWTRELVEVAERAGIENTQVANANVLEPERMPMPEATAELLAPIRQRLGMNVQRAPAVSDDDIPF